MTPMLETPVKGDIKDMPAESTGLAWPKIFLWAALAATVGGALFATKTLATLNKNIAAAKEEARPAAVTMTKITAASCSDCFNLDAAVANFKKQPVSISEERAIAFDAAEGQELITKLAIARVPTYIVTGEVTKKNIEGFIKNSGEVKNDTFVFTKVPPVFIDPVTKQEKGGVAAKYLTDTSCRQCLDPKLTVAAYKQAGIKITEEKELPWDSIEGQRISAKYKITKVPTFLLSADIDLYDAVQANWSKTGTVEADKTYVARNLFLPYRDLAKGQIVGLVDVVYVTDSTCGDCYKPAEVQRNILTRGFGIGIRSERTADVNSPEGKRLKSTYTITKVPTVLLSPEADQYAQLKNVWKAVGTVEADGQYVFREMRQLGGVVYKDLAANKIIRPVQPSAVANGTSQ